MSGNGDHERIFSYIVEEFAPELEIEDAFARKIFFGVVKTRSALDATLQEFAPKWPIEKLSSIERVALEVGAFELLEMPETPTAVILNEAVEIAKTFGDETAGKFINGVLSGLAKKVRAGKK